MGGEKRGTGRHTGSDFLPVWPISTTCYCSELSLHFWLRCCYPDTNLTTLEWGLPPDNDAHRNIDSLGREEMSDAFASAPPLPPTPRDGFSSTT